MFLAHTKGVSRLRKDLIRVIGGEPKANLERNRDKHCRFAADGKATRKKGRDRFKCGKKRQKKGKSSR